MKYLSLCLIISLSFGQEGFPLFQKEFSKKEFEARHQKVYEKIGKNLAIIQGAASPIGYSRFRQYNEFYYLAPIESPHAYLVLDGRNKRSTLYLQHPNTGRERGEGQVISTDDVDLIKEKTNIDRIFPVELMGEHLARIARSADLPVIYTPMSPMEGKSVSRDLALRRDADIQSDPWDGRINRSGRFQQLLKQRYRQIKLKDLTPILDEIRLIKSDEEIKVIKEATRLSGKALMESMKTIEPGMYEYELDAVSKLVFYQGGAQGDAYYSLIASSTNAWYSHYNAGQRKMLDGDFLLMDYAPDYKYYMSDVTRMFPVNGKFNQWQRELYSFYLACYRSILKHITVGKTAHEIKMAAVEDMRDILKEAKFSKAHHQKAAKAFVDTYDLRAQAKENRLGHWVGMATHDVGRWKGPLRPGMVFTIEPALRVPEEKIYIRLEDMIIITESGADIISLNVPLDIDEIEQLMAEDGILQKYR